jgi:hypothetical protein
VCVLDVVSVETPLPKRTVLQHTRSNVTPLTKCPSLAAECEAMQICMHGDDNRNAMQNVEAEVQF